MRLAHDRSRADDFWSQVDKRGHRACWVWMGPRNADGYGQFRGRGAHRVAYELTKRPIPRGMVVRHRCDNPPCVRPEHLRVGTRAQNLIEGLDRGRFYSRRLLDLASIHRRMRQKYGDTPEAGRRTRVNYRAMKRRR